MSVMPAATTKRLVLTGFMGSGKTTVGRLLAEQLGWRFRDLDAVIEQQTGKSIPAIFAENGEAAFRTAEHQAMISVLSEEQMVLALGGGALETPKNVQALRDAGDTVTVYLQAGFETLRRRCERDAVDSTLTVRPNFADADAARKKFEARVPLYAQLADLVVVTDSDGAQDVARKVIERLQAA